MYAGTRNLRFLSTGMGRKKKAEEKNDSGEVNPVDFTFAWLAPLSSCITSLSHVIAFGLSCHGLLAMGSSLQVCVRVRYLTAVR